MRIMIVVWILLICTSFARARIDCAFGCNVPETTATDLGIADCGGCS